MPKKLIVNAAVNSYDTATHRPFETEHSSERPQKISNARRRVVSRRGMFVAGSLTAILVLGLLFHDRLAIYPGHGVGYWLGIAGTALMVALVGYPIRKRSARLLPGSVGFWFRLHMLFGLLGPLLILYHAKFGWRAVNSGIALGAMLLVALSGLIGRYIHVHIYSRYSLRRRVAQDLVAQLRAKRDRLDRQGNIGRALEARLQHFQSIALKPSKKLSHAIFTSMRLRIGIMLERGRLAKLAAREVRIHLKEQNHSARLVRAAVKAMRRDVNDNLDLLIDVGTFSTYERLFAIWRQAHAPLYIFLGIAVIIHVLAVHFY